MVMYANCFGCGEPITEGRVLITMVKEQIAYFPEGGNCYEKYSSQTSSGPLKGRVLSVEELSHILEHCDNRRNLVRSSTKTGDSMGDFFDGAAVLDDFFDIFP